jgi:hypothetical protein
VRSSLPSPAPRGGSWRCSRSTRGRSACGSSRHCRSACAALQAGASPSSTDGAQPVEEQGTPAAGAPFPPPRCEATRPTRRRLPSISDGGGAGARGERVGTGRNGPTRHATVGNRGRQRQRLTSGTHLSGRTKNKGRNGPCFNIR